MLPFDRSLGWAALLLCMLLSTGCAGKKNPTPDDADAQASVAATGGAQAGDSAPDDTRIHTSLPATGDTLYPHRNVIIDELDDYDRSPGQSIADPLEPWNRFWFRFNDIFYLYIARPLYMGYDFVMPREFQSGLKNFLSNMLFPVRFVNCLLQGKPMAAGVEFGRFIVNSTVGFGGFIDVAKGRKTVVDVDPAGEDLGQTLGHWGIGQGFFIVWPIIGPSSPRDTVGLAGDMLLNPSFYLQSQAVATGVNAALRFNSLGDILPMYEDVNSAAVDPYVAMREAYAAFRKEHVRR